MVTVEGLSKRFPVRRTFAETLQSPFRREYQQSVAGVTFDVREGEFFGLLGPNGAGKTTLLKMLSTLVIPDQGTALVDGYDVVEDADETRRLLTPVLTNERSLYWRLSARENLRLFAALQGLGRDETRRRIEEVLADVGLGDVGEKLVGKFSSGMTQRLLIARALLARPRVLLLDEPTRSLDPLSARAFRKFLREEVAGRQGCTVLLATHNAEEALELCDRVAVLDRGRLLAVGTADELARDVGDDRYLVWTPTPDHPSLGAVAQRDGVRVLRVLPPDEEGWARVELEVRGGLDGAAETLDFLTCGGLRVGRFEHVRLSLADLIERIVQRNREGT